jgi:uncharacterized membrane protein
MVVPTLVYGVVIGVLYTIIEVGAFAVSPSPITTYSSNGTSFSYSASTGLGGAGIAVLVVGGIVGAIVAAAMVSAYLGGVFDMANGVAVSIGSFFKPRNLTNVVIAGLIIGIASEIGSVLCVLPGLAVSIITFFAIPAIIDRNLGAIDGLKASWEITKANFVNVLLVWLLALVVLAVGSVCLVGVLVTGPVAALFTVYGYRLISGGQVAPAAM